MKQTVRIACGAGSWGDDIGEPKEILSRTRVDYLVMDYLAEITMSILRAQMDRNPASGYATDVLAVMKDILPLIASSGTKVVTNAGGLNPRACGDAIVKMIDELGMIGTLRVAVVDGDDLMPRLPALAAEYPFESVDHARPFREVSQQIVSANAYVGAGPIREALDRGAHIVITGRCADVSLTVGPLLHEFQWNDWNHISAGVVAGHLLECGAQSTGGNHHAWASVPGLEHVGYPIAEVDRDGLIVLTKAPGTGGIVNRATVTEQLLHEIFDPRAVLTPDATVDWTSINIKDLGDDRVQLSGVRGAPPPSTLKVSMTYRDGFKVVLMWPYAWPHALRKAETALKKIEHTVERLGLRLEATRGDVIGTGAILGTPAKSLMADREEPVEVIARFAARTTHRADAERLAAQQAPMHYGPSALAGHLAGGKGQLSTVYSHWGTVIPGTAVAPRVGLLN